MQRPPGRSSPPILFSRSANEWINKVNQRHKELAGLALSSEQKGKLDRWTEAEFVCATLELDGISVSRDSIASVISSPSIDKSKIDESVIDEGSLVIVDLLRAARAAESIAREKGRAAQLTPDLLIQFDASSGSGFRKSAGDTGRAHKPMPPEHLDRAIESACLWFTAESFDELNPVEQASIVYFRLIEIQPFEQANARGSLVAASLFTMRAGLPPIIIRPEHSKTFRAALEEGARMNTKPMVELIAEATHQTLTEMIERAK
jgi:Fic/DOC family